MSNEQQKLPFKALGQRLRALRQRLQESVPEVSGAVEIDAELLERIESGMERPSEDILQLLINHFDIHDEAESLWRLAGYEMPHDHTHDIEDIAQQSRAGTVMIMAMDPRVVYSDQVHINANRAGIVLNFTQKTTPNPLVAARVGMSREQAAEVARIIQEALHRTEPRRLQRPPQSTDGPDSKPDKQA